MKKLLNETLVNELEVSEIEKTWHYDSEEPSICVRHLAAWNNGYAVEEWISLPATEEDINGFLNHLTIEAAKLEVTGNEFMNVDCSNFPFDIKEFTSLEEISGKLEEIEHFSDDEILVFKLILEDVAYDFDIAVEKVENGEYRIYYDCLEMSDVAYQLVDELGMLDGVPSNLQYYFDYEAFGRDLFLEGSFFNIEYKTWVEIHN